MPGKKKTSTAFTLVIDPGAARVRKKCAPPAKAMADKRRREPRRRVDHLADCDTACR